MIQMYNLKNCNICPRKCGADRTCGTGYCGQGAEIKIARAAPHYWEEPCISGERGSGMICLNGAAARCVSTGDKVIIMCYAQMTPEEARESKPRVVFVDEDNKIARLTRYERHGRLEDLA